MKLLHIDSGLVREGSVSRQLSARIVEQVRKTRRDIDVSYRDLASDPPAHLTAEIFAGAERDGDEADGPTLREIARSRDLLAEFLAADIVVIGAPMYNFSIPSPLKAWLDRVLKAGATFRYTADGPVGLAGGKQVIVASARGGVYSSGPASAMDHQESLLATAFRMMGIEDVRFIRAEGVAKGPEGRDNALRAAGATIRGIGIARKAA
ncbi:MAG TPA: NAD(P)H-dependent oxidoreductase [Xanthomonadaceae bacterium]|nr:NAD(P)H-dependent oxidoreductase [Xanthomonadaceae bacterium]